MNASLLAIAAIVVVLHASPQIAEAQTLLPGGSGRIVLASDRHGPSGLLTAAINREAVRLAAAQPAGVRAARASALQQTQSSGNWIKRHPVWFGTIVGAIAGTAVVGAASGSEAAFLGFWGGAAIGAVTGAVIGR